MKFTTNTKPLNDALNLGIINSNVSNFHKKSCVVQVSADATTLKINIEASMICTELTLKGSGEGDPATVFIDSLLFKQLVNTLESSTVSLLFEENGLVLQSGKSKFNLPKMIDSTEFELKSPVVPEYTDNAIDIDKSDWRFIKDNQMYAISMGFVHPVYTKVWVGESGDVLVGNVDTGRFTHSKKSKLGNTCLLSDTIINLFNSLPEGSKLIRVDDDYLIQFSADSYSYVTQFTPLYEEDEGVGDYGSDIFLSLMQKPDKFVKVPVSPINKLLTQATLLSTSSEDTIKFNVSKNTVHFQNKDVDGEIAGEGDVSIEFELEFKLDAIKEVISNYPDETIQFNALADADDPTAVAGIIVWNNDLVTMIAGVA